MEDDFKQELEKHRNKLLKAVEQGAKIENLTAAPEWEFFEGWLQAARAKALARVLGKDCVNDHNAYLDNRAAVATIDMILDGISRFKDTGAKSANRLIEMDQQTEQVQ